MDVVVVDVAAAAVDATIKFSMNDLERAEIKKIIEAQIGKISEEIKGLEESTRPIPPDNAIGRLTRMEAINEKSIFEANLRQAKLRLERLKAALNRVYSENFGECFKCEEPIPMNRLRVLPESTICVNCLNSDD